jgi:hypothetical protein
VPDHIFILPVQLHPRPSTLERCAHLSTITTGILTIVLVIATVISITLTPRPAPKPTPHATPPIVVLIPNEPRTTCRAWRACLSSRGALTAS